MFENGLDVAVIFIACELCHGILLNRFALTESENLHLP